tara:strand:+ start:1942 stop:2601 length:660 start_codon:yes stop_codon:yes gene_type:complete
MKTNANSPFLDLRLGDCMDLMRDTPDDYYDLALVDPPYGIDWMSHVKNPNNGKDWSQWEYKGWDKTAPTADYFSELKRVSINQVIWGANYMADALLPTPCWLIWDKMQEFSGATFEMAWTSFTSPAKAFRMCRAQAYTNQQKIHPTQKPVALYKWLLSNYAKPGQRILDSHMGSGSIAIACHYFGAHLTATEIDEDYYQAAVERIENETAQGDFLTPMS